MSQITPTRICFGLFEIDLKASELRKAGFRIRLQGQPFKILLVLLERPGDIVTRDELQMQLWGKDTTVDFDRGIAGAINKIRDALGDSAENPRFIETVSKKGYRFIAPVSVEESLPSPEPALPSGPAITELPLTATDPHLPNDSNASPLQAAVILPSAAAATSAPEAKTSPALLYGAFAATLALSVLLTLFLTLRFSRQKAAPDLPQITELTSDGPISTGLPGRENFSALATDGPRIFASALVDGRTALSSIDASTMEVEPLNIPKEVGGALLADISHDGSRLLVMSELSRAPEQPLWIVTTSGMSARRVGDVTAHDATWMPDGRAVLYANGNEMDLVRLDSGRTAVYARLPGRAFSMRWSPDGKLLRFIVLDPLSHRSSLWELDDKSRAPRHLAIPEIESSSVYSGTWLTDGSAYIFQVFGSGASNLWEIGTAARNPHAIQLTNGPVFAESPVAAKSGREVYFVGVNRPSDVERFDAKAQRFLPAPKFLASAVRITYSRDGAWVAWIDTGGRLWRSRADGTENVQLTPDGLDVFLAQWSPDGSQLSAMAREPGEPYQIYLLSRTGGITKQVVSDPRNAADPSFSADGGAIVYGREADIMGQENAPKALQLLDLHSGSTRTIPGSEGLFSPRWSPDGRWIVALSADQNRLMLFSIEKQTWRELYSGSAADPVWSQDSSSVYFYTFPDENPAILKADVSSSATHVVVALSSLGEKRKDAYFFDGLTPLGEPLIQSRVGNGNLYVLRLNDSEHQ